VGFVVALGVLGVLCLAAAAILKWVVTPNEAKLPSDQNTTRQYEGNAKILLNPQALSTGDLTKAVLVNTPVKANRNAKVLAVQDNAAEMQDTRTLATASGEPIGETQATYAVDRKTLEATPDHPSSWQVTAAQGLTVSWPIGAEKKDYTGWVQETQATTPLKYLRQETKQDLTTYVYQSSSQPAPITDPQVLKTLPQALPAGTLAALSSELPLPPDVKSQLSAQLPQLTQSVPLSYTYQVNSTYWVEPTTGIVIDIQREEIRKAGLSVGGKTLASVLPVYDVTTAYTSTTASDAAAEAKDDKNKINLFGTTLPLILLIVGILALLAALLLFLLSRRSPAGTQPSPPAGGMSADAAG